MDFRNLIFNACRDGKLRRLKMCVDHRSQEDVQVLIHSQTDGATPLLIACRNGHLEVVEYLIERCAANMEQCGAVIFDGEAIENATPLWCAAAAGHIFVVKTLINHGVNVNSTTKTNSTPLRAACFDGHYEIVKYLITKEADIEVANCHGHTCLMIACYKGHIEIAKYLIDLGAKMDRKSVKGNTALHDCAESGSLVIMKMLLERGAKIDVDSYGMTPLLAAAVTGHTHIVNHLLRQKDLITRQERVDALELLGSTFIDKKRDLLGAILLWKEAMRFRFDPALPPLKKSQPPPPVLAYLDSIEVQTLEELDGIGSEPEALRMQALLVRERLLGPAHPDTSYYIRYRGAVYADTGQFSRCLQLWSHALNMQQRLLEPLSPLTLSSLLSFTDLFVYIMDDGRKSASSPKLNINDVLYVLNCGINELISGRDFLTTIRPMKRDSEKEVIALERTLSLMVQIVALLSRLLLLNPDFDEETKLTVHKAVFKLVQLGSFGPNQITPLHAACTKDTGRLARCLSTSNFPSIHAATLLLCAGANPNACDANKRTPLHTVAAIKPLHLPVVHALLDSGSHFDRVDNCGQTFIDLITCKSNTLNKMKYTTLQCLAAKAMQEFSIPYKGIIAKDLADFVEIH